MKEFDTLKEITKYCSTYNTFVTNAEGNILTLSNGEKIIYNNK